MITSSELNRITLEIAAVLEKHGYPPEYNESYNCLRLAIGRDYFEEWLGIKLEDNAFDHVSWAKLKEDLSVKPPHKQALSWLRGRLPL